MKFQFRLESILKHREQLKNEAYRVWVEAQSKVNECLGEIQHMYQQVDDSRKQVADAEAQLSGQQVAVFTSNYEFICGQKVKIERKRAEARELMKVAEDKRELLLEATQEFESLSRLKQRKQEEFKKKKKQREIKLLDDLVTMRAKGSIL